MWVTPEAFHCLMVIYSSLIICECFTFNSATPEYFRYMTVGSLGNLLVLSTILRSSEMRTARNVLIGNLALSDLCLCVVTMPLTLVRKTSIILCYNLVTDLSMGQLFLGKEEDGHLLALLSS